MIAGLAARQRWVAAALALAAVLATAWWAWQGREVQLVAAPGGRVQCVSYAPSSRRDETLVNVGVVVAPERIEGDLKLLAERFDCVRTYSQSNGLDEVPRIARGLGLKVLMGVWISRDPAVNEREIESAIRIAERDRDVIRGIVVGNEVMLRGEQAPEALAGYIRRVRTATGLPVTYADVWEFWRKYRTALAEEVDFITIHILPYWEDKPVPVEAAVAHVRDIYALMQKEFPGRTLLIGETGWPSEGRQRQGASPGLVNQARFIREFLAFTSAAQVPYSVIEAFDQPWKRRQEGAVGGYWGLYTNEREAKFSLVDPVVEEPRWPWALGLGLLVSIGFLLATWASGVRLRVFTATIVALGGYVTGCVLAAEARTAWAASRSQTEFVIAGTWSALALITAWWFVRNVAVSGDQSREPLRGWRVLRFIWLFSATVVALLLVMDSRYRDFPIALFLAPVGSMVLALLATRERLGLGLEERIMAGWLLAAAGIIAVLEGFLNGSALVWCALLAAFSLSVLLPRRGAGAA
jgi:exo-beta-1,3-glucanase (GH17 family)